MQAPPAALLRGRPPRKASSFVPIPDAFENVDTVSSNRMLWSSARLPPRAHCDKPSLTMIDH